MPKNRRNEPSLASRRSGTRARLPVVLVAEEFVDGRAAHAEFFVREGFAVVEARDAQEVRVAADRARPDVVVLDLELPGAPGVDLAREILAGERTRAPIVALAGHAAQIDPAREAGCNAVLSKPAGVQQLRRAVMLALARARGAGRTSSL